MITIGIVLCKSEQEKKMDSVNAARLRRLYKLYNKVCDTILGHPIEDRADLLQLKEKVVAEIRAIEQSSDVRFTVHI
jgi:hypothetical protein